MVDDEIVIRRTGSGLPTLTLVDLPGICTEEVGDLMRKTQELVDYHINEEKARKQYPPREAEARSRHKYREACREEEARERGVAFLPQPFAFPSLDTVIRAIQDTIVICCVEGDAVSPPP